MDAKEGFIILLNLAILGMVIAAAVYIFQIGNGNRSVKCTALDKFGDTCTGLEVSAVGGCNGVGISGCPMSYETDATSGTSKQCILSGSDIHGNPNICILGSTCTAP